MTILIGKIGNETGPIESRRARARQIQNALLNSRQKGQPLPTPTLPLDLEIYSKLMNVLPIHIFTDGFKGIPYDITCRPESY